MDETAPFAMKVIDVALSQYCRLSENGGGLHILRLIDREFNPKNIAESQNDELKIT